MNVKTTNMNIGGGIGLAKIAWSSCRFAIVGAILISMAMNVLVLTGPFYMLQIEFFQPTVIRRSSRLAYWLSFCSSRTAVLT